MFAIRLDERIQILDIATSGFWTTSEAAAYAAQLRQSAGLLRQRSGRVRAVINALDSPVQSAEVMGIVGNIWQELLTDPDDRVALMVESSLAKMQAKRFFGSDHWQAFLSPNAARTWLSV